MGGTGLTTAEARQASSYAGWDFTNVWFQSGDMRLILRSEAATPVNGVTTITNLHQLALVGANLSGSYVLGANIDASASAGADAAGIRSAKGFVPIGPAYATGAVSGGNIVGGLIGQNYGAVNQAYASGSVSGGGQSGASSAKTTERSIRHMQRGRSARLEARVASSATTTLPLHRATWMRRRAGW